MSPPKPEERRRRYHKRSRNGCIDCKRKHIRCDEKKPLCTNCLVKGDPCGYADAQEASPGPSSIKVEEEEYWDSGAAAPVQGMSSSHMLVGGHQMQVAQGDSSYQYDNYSNRDAGGHTADAYSQQSYYWGQQGMAPDASAGAAMGYAMGPSQQAYNWRDVPPVDPTGGQAASYWSQDPNQQPDAAAPAEPERRREGKHSSRKDGGKSRR